MGSTLDSLMMQKLRYLAAAQAAKAQRNWQQYIHHIARLQQIAKAIEQLEQKGHENDTLGRNS